jgi:hypothetical protein
MHVVLYTHACVQAEALRGEVAAAVQQAEARAAEARAEVSARAVMLGEQVAELRRRLEEQEVAHRTPLVLAARFTRQTCDNQIKNCWQGWW